MFHDFSSGGVTALANFDLSEGADFMVTARLSNERLPDDEARQIRREFEAAVGIEAAFFGSDDDGTYCGWWARFGDHQTIAAALDMIGASFSIGEVENDLLARISCANDRREPWQHDDALDLLRV